MKLISSVLIASSLTVVACTAPGASDAEPSASASHQESTAVCTEATKADILARMAAQPITPPRFAAGLDLAATDDWSGLLLDTAQSALCAVPKVSEAGEKDGDTTAYYDFGGTEAAPALELGFSETTNKLNYVGMMPGYTGGVSFKSRDGKHAYDFRIGSLTKDGQPLVIDWKDAAAREAVATELDDALVATFAPELPAVDTNCRASARCLALFASSDGETMDSGVFGARDIGMYFFVDLTAGTAPSMLYMFPHAARLTVPPPPPPSK